MPHIIVGTAGHIDHGKTSLVKALTGIDTDRLKEEKERGITIDLGFASLRLDERTTAGIVDVPGHERFIKNMLAGVGGIRPPRELDGDRPVERVGGEQDPARHALAGQETTRDSRRHGHEVLPS